MSRTFVFHEGGRWHFEGPSVNGHERGSITLRNAADVSMQQVQWIERGRIPLGEITVVAGIGGLGKSLWMCHLFARITRGHSDLGRPKSVVLLSAEDAWTYTLKPRLIAAGADLDRVMYLDSDVFVIPDDIPRIEAAIREHPESIVALGLDPLVAFIRDGTDTHRDHDTRRALAPLAGMANQLNIAVLGIMHLNKKDGSDPYKRLSSSVAFWKAVRSVLIWGEDPNDPEHRVLASGKMNLAPKPESLRYRLERAAATENDVTVETVVLRPAGVVALGPSEVIAGKTGSGKTGQAEFLLSHLWREAGGAIPAEHASEAAKEHGISESTMQRAREKLGGTTQKRGFSGGWDWIPPDGFFSRQGIDESFAASTVPNPLQEKESTKASSHDFLGGAEQMSDFFGEETRLLRSDSSSSLEKASPIPAPKPPASCGPTCTHPIMVSGQRMCQLPDPF